MYVAVVQRRNKVSCNVAKTMRLLNAQLLFPFTAILLHVFGSYIGTVEVRNVVCGRFLYFGFDHITLLSGRCLSVAFHSYLAAAVGGVVSGTGQIRIA